MQLIDEESAEQIRRFVLNQRNRDGGFRGRGEASDLYYTLFALECLQALDQIPPLEEVGAFLDRFRDGGGLDLVHLTCLARCLSRLPSCVAQRESSRAVLRRLDQLRSPTGGFRLTCNAPVGSIYACFLAVLAHEENGFDVPDPEGIRRCVQALRSADGAFADQPGLAGGTTTVTAAAVLLLALLGDEIDPTVADWLLARRGRHGGFYATAKAPVPDLLSTATALLALQALARPLPDRNRTMELVEALWEDSGGFIGHPMDDTADCEYTYYGLLSLGALAPGGVG